RDVGPHEVSAAVGAGVLALEVVVAADGAEHGRLRGYSTVQVSPATRTLAMSPGPDFSTACWIWSWTRSECVGRSTSRSTPTGTGHSGQNMRDGIRAR